MTDFTVQVFNHEFEPVHLPEGVELIPRSWEANAIGGTEAFEIEARGDETRLSELLHWIGYTLWIVNSSNEYVAWGDIEHIELGVRGVTVGTSLGGVVNRLKVLYADDMAGGSMAAEETEWAEDLDSQTLYSRRERLHTAKTPMRRAQAEQLRDTILSHVSAPKLLLGQVAEGDSTYASISGRGFWSRMERIYYANDNGRTEHTTAGTPWPLGLGFTSTYTAFLVTESSKFTIHHLLGWLQNFTAQDLRVSVAGAGYSANDGVFRVKNADEKEPVNLTKTTISFDPNDDIMDSTYGLGKLEPGDLIQVSGSTLNSGTHHVKTSVSERIEVSPAYYGDDIETEAAGPSINILRGNMIEVEQPVLNEHAGANVTVTAHGERIAQSFRTYSSESWVLASVSLRLRKEGTPTDNVQVRLRADSGGAPTGAILDSAIMDDAVISPATTGTWVKFVMTGGVVLSPSTVYWLEIFRGGVNDPHNFFEVFVDSSGTYTDGTVLLYTGTSYVAPFSPLSVGFRLEGGLDTALQVADICADAGVFSNVLVQDLSGVISSQFRDGTLWSADHARELLDTGDTSDTRLLATVNPQRVVIIRTQPPSSSAQYVWSRGQLYTLQGTPVPAGLLPVGEWCHVDDPLLLNGALAQASPFFVEKATYNPDAGWRLFAPDEPDEWDMGTVRDG